MGAALRTRRTVRTAAELAESLLERRNPAVARRLTARERTVELAAAGGLLAVAAALGATAGRVPVTTAALLVLSYALVRRVRFPLGPGLIRPTQVVFVPMLFLTPAAAVPLLVALGGVLGELPDLMRRRAHPERVAVVVADGWYAIGPALAVAWLDQRATLAVLVVALVAQFACDLASSCAREYFGARIHPAELLPVLALVYLIDATLAPIGLLAVFASDLHANAFLLAIAPAALLGLIARERSERIARELTLERAFRRSTRALDARADDVRLQAGRLQRGEAEPEDRAALERVLLATTIEAVQADCGRLSEVDEHGALHARLTIGEVTPALAQAELALGSPRANALAIGVGHSHVLAVLRAGSPFSTVERDLLEHLAAQAAVTLENLRLAELMRRKEAELRAILEGVADAIAAEDPDGRLVFVNAAAARLLDGADSLGAALGVAPTLLPGHHVFEGERPDPLVVKHAHRWSRVQAGPVLEGGHPRLAISVVEDITELKAAEEAQRLLSDVSRVLAGSLDLDRTLPEVARLAAAHFGACVIELAERPATGAGTDDLTLTLPLHDGALHLGGHVDHATAGELALRIGSAVENARLYRQREAVAHALQRSLLPPELPRIPGLDCAALYRPAGAVNEVGGDFYDLFPIDRGAWFAVIGDVCGKGAEAAAVTALARYTIRAAVVRHRSPAAVLRRLNEAMLRQRAGRFVTLACAHIEVGTTVTATVACGGHPPPRVLRATGLVETLGANGTIVGVLPQIEAVDRTARLDAGDALVLYTDGLTEARAPHVMTPYALDRAVAGARRLDAGGIVGHLSAQVPDPLRDDLALLVLRAQPLL